MTDGYDLMVTMEQRTFRIPFLIITLLFLVSAGFSGYLSGKASALEERSQHYQNRYRLAQQELMACDKQRRAVYDLCCSRPELSPVDWRRQGSATDWRR